MSLRALAILLALLAAVVAVVLVVDEPKREPPAAESETLASFLPSDLDAVAAIEIERHDGITRVERVGTAGWRLLRPVEAEADPRPVQALFVALRDARIRRVVEERAGDRAGFGLAPPDATVRILPTGSAAAVSFAIGRASPVGSGRYTSTADGRVLLVEGLDAGVMDRSADSLRERRLFPLDVALLRRIDLVRPAGRLALVRGEDEGWRLVEPVSDSADPEAADALARAVLDLATSGAPIAGSPGGGDLAIELVATDGRRLRARVGPADARGKRPARRIDSSIGGDLDASAIVGLERDASEFRDRRVVLAEPSDVREVRWVEGERSVRAWREAADRPWSVEERPGTGASAASATKIYDALDRLRWLRATGFEKSPPSAFGRAVVLLGESGEMGRIEIAGTDVRRVVRSSWRPGVLSVVDADRLGAFPERAADLFDAPSQGASRAPS